MDNSSQFIRRMPLILIRSGANDNVNNMPSITSALLEEMTWQEVKQAVSDDYLLILTVGAIEQHGPHLPLSTDVIIALEIAKAMAKRLKAVVAPPIYYGHHVYYGGKDFLVPRV